MCCNLFISNIDNYKLQCYTGRITPRVEYMKQITIDMGKNKYKELKELSYKRYPWRTTVN